MQNFKVYRKREEEKTEGLLLELFSIRTWTYDITCRKSYPVKVDT